MKCGSWGSEYVLLVIIQNNGYKMAKEIIIDDLIQF